jgi:hypothetical protein
MPLPQNRASNRTFSPAAYRSPPPAEVAWSQCADAVPGIRVYGISVAENHPESGRHLNHRRVYPSTLRANQLITKIQRADLRASQDPNIMRPPTSDGVVLDLGEMVKADTHLL